MSVVPLVDEQRVIARDTSCCRDKSRTMPTILTRIGSRRVWCPATNSQRLVEVTCLKRFHNSEYMN